MHRCRRPEELEPTAQGGATTAQGEVVCSECGRTFRRQGGLKRHKCILERSKPVEQQRGSVQCIQCHRWLRSAGGLGVHRKTCRSSS